MSDMDKDLDAGLGVLFDAAKASNPMPSNALMAQILADARAVQSEPVRVSVADKRSLRSILGEVFGGFAGVSTLAACVGLGLIIGITAPEAIAPYWGGFGDTEFDDAFGLYFDDEL